MATALGATIKKIVDYSGCTRTNFLGGGRLYKPLYGLTRCFYIVTVFKETETLGTNDDVQIEVIAYNGAGNFNNQIFNIVGKEIIQYSGWQGSCNLGADFSDDYTYRIRIYQVV